MDFSSFRVKYPMKGVANSLLIAPKGAINPTLRRCSAQLLCTTKLPPYIEIVAFLSAHTPIREENVV